VGAARKVIIVVRFNGLRLVVGDQSRRGIRFVDGSEPPRGVCLIEDACAVNRFCSWRIRNQQQYLTVWWDHTSRDGRCRVTYSPSLFLSSEMNLRRRQFFRTLFRQDKRGPGTLTVGSLSRMSVDT
jgi:hypothetical protein